MPDLDAPKRQEILIGANWVENVPNAKLIMIDPPYDGIIFSVLPSTITENTSVNWYVEDITGMTQPIRFWKSTSARTISLEAKFYATFSSKLQVVNGINLIRSWLYPLERVGAGKKPTILRFIFGELFNVQCVMASDIAVTWGDGEGGNSAWEVNTLCPLVASASFSIAVHDTDLFADEVASTKMPQTMPIFDDVRRGR